MNQKLNRDVALFASALELPVDERVEYLKRECGADHALRSRVEALLRADSEAGNFMEQTPGKPAATRVPAVGERPGDRIGRYKLLQQIGEGGCGVVFMAEQEEPVRRRVALKVIKPGMDTKSVIARFEAERQALALMDHPNIAKVFDAGATESGRPFVVMELIRGIKITDYCDHNSLTTEERLGLFVQVCQAVQHAHQKGIIHRDLKPSNILVTETVEGAALPVVIDFGIAKATTNQQLTDRTFFTAFEMLIGTPAYMSPEQAALSSADVDTRTDIYSLGVLLYELVTGSTPFDGKVLLKAGLDEIRRVIREVEPARPSTRLRTMVASDLTTVAQHRRSDPPYLIRSVRGDLDWIVMKALEKDRTRRYETANGLALDVKRFLANETVSARPCSRFYKFKKAVQRNKLLSIGSGVIAVLLLASLSVVTASLRQERQALLAAQSEEARSRQVTLFLEDMLQGVGPSVARGRDTTILREILDKTAERVEKELTNQPVVQANLQKILGRVYHKLGDYSHAEQMHRAALGLNRQLFGPESREAAESINDLGEALIARGDLAGAENAHQEALRIRRKLLGTENTEVAASLNGLANVYRQQHRFTEAETLTREALEIRQRIFGSESLAAADSLRNLSIILADRGKPVEAEAMMRKVLAIRQRQLGAQGQLVAATLDDVAWTAGLNGNLDEAESLEGEALAVKRKSLGDEHPDVAKSLFLLGQRMQLRGKQTDAIAVLSAALSIQTKLLGEDNPDTLYTLRNLSWALETEGKWEDAETANRTALALWRKRFGPQSDQAMSALKDLTRVLLAQGKLAEAEQSLKGALTPAYIKKQASADVLIQRLDLLARQGRWSEAAADAALVHAYQPDEHYRFHSLAPLLVMIHDLPAYEALCRSIQLHFPDTLNPYIAERMSKDCLLLATDAVDLRWADNMADIALTRGSNDPSMPFFQTAKAFSRYRMGRFQEAVDWAEKALNSTQVYVQAQAHACGILAMAQWRLGREEEARAALIRGETLMPRTAADDGKVDFGGGWVAWLMARISLDEATAMIRPKPSEKSANKP